VLKLKQLGYMADNHGSGEHDGSRTHARDGPISLIDHTLKTGNLEGFGAGTLIKNQSSTVNPCPKHPLNEIAYLDKTTRQGACEICLPMMLRANHEMLPIR